MQFNCIPIYPTSKEYFFISTSNNFFITHFKCKKYIFTSYLSYNSIYLKIYSKNEFCLLAFYLPMPYSAQIQASYDKLLKRYN